MSRYIIPILLLIIAGALSVAITKPTFDRAQIVEKELTEYRQTIERADLLRNRIEDLTAERNNISSSDLMRLDALLPEKVDTIKLAFLLDTVASRNRMVIQNIDVSEEGVSAVEPAPEAFVDDGMGNLVPVDNTAVRGEQFVAVPISFSIIGTYAQFRQFVADLEQNLVLMDIVHLTVGDASEEDLPTYDVTVHVYEHSAR